MHVIWCDLVVALFRLRGEWDEESDLAMSDVDETRNKGFIAYFNEAHSCNKTDGKVVSMRPFYREDDEGDEQKARRDQSGNINPVRNLCSFLESYAASEPRI